MKRSADAAFVVEQLPSPVSSPASSPAPECPPRKRSRSELTTEERREARAHRNRIAAQNSRDRRKAQFAYLERRVAELEEENRQLRAGMGLTAPATPTLDGQLVQDSAREKENEELRERIKTLENGWDAVVKALAASGLPLNIPAPPPHVSSLSDSSTAAAPRVIQVVVPPTPDSPLPSSPESSIFEFADARAHSPPSTGGDHRCPSFIIGAPAAGGLDTNRLELELRAPQSIAFAAAATGATGPSATAAANPPIDESAMEDLFREILAPSPSLPAAPMPSASASPRPRAAEAAAAPAPVTPLPAATLDWEGEAEMQRLLDMLPDVRPDVGQRLELNIDTHAVDFPSALELDLCAWDIPSAMSSTSPTVGVF